MRKFECNECAAECELILKTDEFMPQYCLSDKEAADWQEVEEGSAKNSQTAVNSEQLPKLTVEVFDRPDCPKWANYAYVDGLGNCILLRHKPCRDIDRCLPIIDDRNKRMMYGWGRFCQLKGNYIERPATALPDWCKVGAVGYDAMNNEYFEITHIENDSFRAKSIDSSNSCSSLYFNEFVYEANKRPFNEAEMKALVGKIIEFKNGDTTLATGYSEEFDEGIEGYNCGIWTCWGWSMGAKELMNECIIDGKPCYVLEHLNDKGEWVE